MVSKIFPISLPKTDEGTIIKARKGVILVYETRNKWAGGKGFLVDTVKDMQPKGYKRYYEPFAGGAAVLLGLRPAAATLNDINPELTNVYIQIKSSPAAVIEELTEPDNRHQTAANPGDFYDAVRARFNLCMGKNTPAQAARFIYLNKHCFNGLYRVNSSGDFNVPFGTRQGNTGNPRPDPC